MFETFTAIRFIEIVLIGHWWRKSSIQKMDCEKERVLLKIVD